MVVVAAALRYSKATLRPVKDECCLITLRLVLSVILFPRFSASKRKGPFESAKLRDQKR